MDAVMGLDADTPRMTLAVMLALNPVGKLAIDAVTGLVADTGSVMDPVMLTFEEPPVEPVTHRGAACVLVTGTGNSLSKIGMFYTPKKAKIAS